MKIKIISCLILASIINLSHAGAHKRFEGSEHIHAGDAVGLKLNNPADPQYSYHLHLPNGLALTYGEILSFGDLYEIPNKPFSVGSTEERRSVFIAAFNSFARDLKAIEEVNKLVVMLHDEERLVMDAIDRGKKPEEVFYDITEQTNRQANCITGGGCGTKWWLTPGRYLKLASEDYDHFGEEAWQSYQLGHQLAVEEAQAARQTKDQTRLEIAYAMNAFASHYLADSFAAGHMRTPRRELHTTATPNVAGGLLSHFMHNEESVAGLHVHNHDGDQWIAYGDKYYFSPINAANKEMLHKALQSSADEVFEAFQTGTVSIEQVSRLRPIVNETSNNPQQDITPLFFWDQSTKRILRRNDITNPHDRHFTANWWTWSTLILLVNHYGLTASDQAALAQTGYANKAITDGIITNREIIGELNSK